MTCVCSVKRFEVRDSRLRRRVEKRIYKNRKIEDDNVDIVMSDIGARIGVI